MTTLLIRPNRNEPDREAILAKGLSVTVDPFLTISPVENPEGATRLLDIIQAGGPAWLVVTSLNAWDNWLAQLPTGALEAAIADNRDVRFGAIGETTAEVLYALGIEDVAIPSRRDGDSLADLIAQTQPCPVVLPSGSISMRSIPETLVPRGFPVNEEVFYHTEAVRQEPASVKKILSGEVTSVVFRSPSAVRAFFSFVPEPPATLALVCGGRTTAREVERCGALPTIISVGPTPVEVAEAVWTVERGSEGQ
jgi:uroporphyrinogen-III synthase